MLSNGIAISAGLLIIAAIASLVPRFGWAFDLISHFRIQLAWLNAASTLFTILTQQPWFALGNSLAALSIFGSLFPFRGSRSEPAEAGIQLVLFNVLMRNRSYDRTLDFALSAAPDLLGLVEVDQHWIDALAPLRNVLPYQAAIPHPASYGLALFSRYPIRSWHRAKVRGSDVYHLEADVELSDGYLHVVLVHLPPPFTPNEMRKRDERLASLQESAAASEWATLLMGDFNASPWTPSLLAVEKATGMISFRRGQGLFPTWPGRLGPCRIPIDQILGSGGLVKFGRAKVGPDLGSDHLPITVGLTVVPPRAG